MLGRFASLSSLMRRFHNLAHKTQKDRIVSARVIAFVTCAVQIFATSNGLQPTSYLLLVVMPSQQGKIFVSFYFIPTGPAKDIPSRIS